MKNKSILGVFLAVALAGSVSADVIDFSTGPGVDSGTVSYAGGANPLVGSNILIGQVKGVGTPSNNGVIDSITNGILAFTTGAFLSFDSLTQTYTFGPGGSLTITGMGPGCTTIGGCPTNNPDTSSGPNLVTGSILSATYQAGEFNIALVAGNDTKDPLLVQFFGFDPSNTTFHFSGSVHTAPPVFNERGGFTANSTSSTDISNTATVPDHPGTLSLLLLTMTVIGLAARRVRFNA